MLHEPIGSSVISEGKLKLDDNLTDLPPSEDAPIGSPDDVTDTLHRIEPCTVRREVEAAGFEFVGASSVPANPADPHTAGVFDPSIRGRTDQFILKFRRPT